jgi:hypothetical protein
VHHRSNGTATSTRVLESHSALTGRGSRPCNQALCVWQAPRPSRSLVPVIVSALTGSGSPSANGLCVSGRIECQRGWIIRSANEGQCFCQATHSSAVNFCLVHSRVTSSIGQLDLLFDKRAKCLQHHNGILRCRSWQARHRVDGVAGSGYGRCSVDVPGSDGMGDKLPQKRPARARGSVGADWCNKHAS